MHKYLCFFLIFLNLYLFSNETKNSDSEQLSLKAYYSPSKNFKKNALIKDDSIYQKGNDNFVKFWEEQAESLDWFSKWDTVLQWNPPFSKWYLGGKLNACYNCLDRHILSGLGNKKALIWEGENGEERIYTFYDLYKEVNKAANALKKLGVKKGDTVAFYMSMIPETFTTILACSRIGAPHAVIFGGIGATGVRDRIIDSKAKFVITVDGCLRRGKILPYKDTLDNAIKNCPQIEKVIVVKRARNDISFKENRDCWYHNIIKNENEYCKPEAMNSEDTLFILYTSGSTGKSKGIIHSTAGYLVGVQSTYKWVFDINPNDIFWSTADIGWITGHSFVLYGPLLNGTTTVVYEGAFDYPNKERIWNILDKYKVSIFYTAPTAIRMFMKWGTKYVEKHSFSSLRLIGSIGEPINPKAWLWYHENIGKNRCPIVDTWFQTETGGLVISPLPGITDLKPGSVTKPLPGFDVAVLDKDGNEVEKGFLAIKKPYPSMMRGILNDVERYKKTYWSKWDGKYYYTGDEAIKDKDGYIWVTGRLDDVLKISGHRIGTAEIESILVEHPYVAEAAVIGIDDPIKGQDIVAFIMLRESTKQLNLSDDEIEKLLKEKIVKGIGSYTRPRHIIISEQLPKNRSGKIMRRLLRDLIEDRALGDITTLENKEVIKELKMKCNRKKNSSTNFDYQKTNFSNTLIHKINQDSDQILSPIIKNYRNPEVTYQIEEFHYENAQELSIISNLIQNNFKYRLETANAPKNIRKLYDNANSKKDLLSTIKVPHTHAYVLKANDQYIGFLVVRFNKIKDSGKHVAQIKRMHAFHEICNGKFFGVGKTLLNLTATIGKCGGTNTLLTTAPYLLKDYFEKINWHGSMIYTNYALPNEIVLLPQFRCEFIVDNQFKGF